MKISRNYISFTRQLNDSTKYDHTFACTLGKLPVHWNNVFVSVYLPCCRVFDECCIMNFIVLRYRQQIPNAVAHVLTRVPITLDMKPVPSVAVGKGLMSLIASS